MTNQRLKKSLEYVPFGPEWAKEMMQWDKKMLVNFLQDLLVANKNNPNSPFEQLLLRVQSGQVLLCPGDVNSSIYDIKSDFARAIRAINSHVKVDTDPFPLPDLDVEPYKRFYGIVGRKKELVRKMKDLFYQHFKEDYEEYL